MNGDIKLKLKLTQIKDPKILREERKKKKKSE